MTAKKNTTPADPLLDIARDWLRKDDARTLDDRARVRATAMRAALEGAPEQVAAVALKHADSIPGEDSGEALVGRVCYCWNIEGRAYLYASKIKEWDEECDVYRDTDGDSWDHARPIELGLPDWFKE